MLHIVGLVFEIQVFKGVLTFENEVFVTLLFLINSNKKGCIIVFWKWSGKVG